MLERTPLVLGIQFDKQRLRKSIFPRWQRALHRTRKHKRAAAEHDLRLLCERGRDATNPSGCVLDMEVSLPHQSSQEACTSEAASLLPHTAVCYTPAHVR